MSQMTFSPKCNILAQLASRVDHSCTPDFIELKKQAPYQPVFVYGTLKRGNRLHDIISHCDYLGKGMTTIPRWTLKNNPGSFFPIMFKLNADNLNKGKVMGEIYAVDPLTMLELDEIERNGKMYQRQRVDITFKDQIYKTRQGDKHPSLKIWAYVGLDNYWESLQVIGVPYKDKAGTRIYDWGAKDPWKEFMEKGIKEDMNDDIPWGRPVG